MAKVAILLTSMNTKTEKVEVKWYECKKDELITIDYPENPDLTGHKIEISMGRRAVIKLQEKADEYLKKNEPIVENTEIKSTEDADSESETTVVVNPPAAAKSKAVVKKPVAPKKVAAKKASVKAPTKTSAKTTIKA